MKLPGDHYLLLKGRLMHGVFRAGRAGASLRKDENSRVAADSHWMQHGKYSTEKIAKTNRYALACLAIAVELIFALCRPFPPPEALGSFARAK